MALALIWSNESLDDLAQIHAYIARDSLFYADDVVLRIIASAESLLEMPKRGRVVPEIRDSTLRELIIGNYRLVYRLSATRVEIAGVIHGARLLPDRDSW